MFRGSTSRDLFINGLLVFKRIVSIASSYKDEKRLMVSEITPKTCSGAVVRRSSVKKSALENFSKFTGKRLCRSPLFYKVADLRPATIFKNILRHRCFSMSFEKIFRNTFSYRTPPLAASACCKIILYCLIWFIRSS